MSIVNLKGISYSFKDKQKRIEIPILHNVNLTVNPGEFHLITGPSGSGKTTLLQIIGTLLHPDKGERKLFMKEISPNTSSNIISETRSQIGYLFQTPFLPPDLSVKDFIEIVKNINNNTISKSDIESFQTQLENIKNSL